MNQLEQLQHLVEKGFYLHNIKDVISFCNNISDDQYVLLAHTLKCIYVDVFPFFDETATDSAVAEQFNFILVPEILKSIQKIDVGCSKSDQYDLLVHIIKLSRENITRLL